MALSILKRSRWPLGTCPDVATPLTPLGRAANLLIQGGSISYGYPPDQQCAAPHLQRLLVRDGVAHTFIGPYSTQSTPSVPCGAIIGSSIKAFGPGGANDIANAPRLAHILNADVILLDLVVNTAYSDAETATWVADVLAYLQHVDTLRGNATCRFVIDTDQDAGDAPRRARVVTLRGQFPTLYSTLDANGFANRYREANIRTVTMDSDHMRSEGQGARVHCAEQLAIRSAWHKYHALRSVLGLPAVF